MMGEEEKKEEDEESYYKDYEKEIKEIGSD